MTSRSLRRRCSRRRPGVLVCSRDVSGHASRVMVTLRSEGVSQSFLIMSGDTFTVGLNGYVQQSWNGPATSVRIPVTISARLS